MSLLIWHHASNKIVKFLIIFEQLYKYSKQLTLSYSYTASYFEVEKKTRKLFSWNFLNSVSNFRPIWTSGRYILFYHINHFFLTRDNNIIRIRYIRHTKPEGLGLFNFQILALSLFFVTLTLGRDYAGHISALQVAPLKEGK